MRPVKYATQVRMVLGGPEMRYIHDDRGYGTGDQGRATQFLVHGGPVGGGARYACRWAVPCAWNGVAARAAGY